VHNSLTHVARSSAVGVTLFASVVATQNTPMAELAKAGATPLTSERSSSLKMDLKRNYREHVRMAESAVVAPEVPRRKWQTPQTRRDFLAASTTGALALLLAGLPRGWVGGAYAGDGPETPNVRIGIIALTDCSSIVMAHELGFFKQYGIESTISKEASWAVIRDRLTLGENQATHILLGMPYASTMGLLGSPVKPMIIPFYLNRNGQALTLTKELLAKGVKTPQALKPLAEEAKRAGRPMSFAMTFPPGTHAKPRQHFRALRHFW